MEANGGGRRWPKRKKCKMHVGENNGKTTGKTTFLVKRRDAADIKHASQNCKNAPWKKTKKRDAKWLRQEVILATQKGSNMEEKKEAKMEQQNGVQGGGR